MNRERERERERKRERERERESWMKAWPGPCLALLTASAATASMLLARTTEERGQKQHQYNNQPLVRE